MRWGEMDALGHMNNTVYFRYLEQARISWFDSARHRLQSRQRRPDLGSINCRFRIPIVYPADLVVSVYGGQPRNSSFVLKYTITRAAGPARVYARAKP